jgi:hypothetical protein
MWSSVRSRRYWPRPIPSRLRNRLRRAWVLKSVARQVEGVRPVGRGALDALTRAHDTRAVGTSPRRRGGPGSGMFETTPRGTSPLLRAATAVSRPPPPSAPLGNRPVLQRPVGAVVVTRAFVGRASRAGPLRRRGSWCCGRGQLQCGAFPGRSSWRSRSGRRGRAGQRRRTGSRCRRRHAQDSTGHRTYMTHTLPITDIRCVSTGCARPRSPQPTSANTSCSFTRRAPPDGTA